MQDASSLPDATPAGPSSPSAAAKALFPEPGDPEQASKCRTAVDCALRTCPKVKFMMEALASVGRPVDAEFVQCAKCPDEAPTAGGYLPAHGFTVLCQQWIAKHPGEVENTLVHEMVHAYDDRRALVDWNDLTQHACTEIRAANLSGDCTFQRELDRNNISLAKLAGAGMRCVRRRAQLSVAMHPDCPDEAAARAAVERAWTTCFNDKAPFDDNPVKKD